jgi:hypothetical protein
MTRLNSQVISGTIYPRKELVQLSLLVSSIICRFQAWELGHGVNAQGWARRPRGKRCSGTAAPTSTARTSAGSAPPRNPAALPTNGEAMNWAAIATP